MPTYRWDHPSDWLNEKVNTLEGERDANALAGMVRSLLTAMPEDDVQDIFQQEMDADGYFEEEEDNDGE